MLRGVLRQQLAVTCKLPCSTASERVRLNQRDGEKGWGGGGKREDIRVAAEYISEQYKHQTL